MKKQILLMTAAVLTITSCSKDESTEVNNGQAIDFTLTGVIAKTSDANYTFTIEGMGTVYTKAKQ